MFRRRLMLSAALVGVLALSASPAYAAETDSDDRGSCFDFAAAAVQEHDIDTSSGVNFGCIGETLSIQSAETGEVLVEESIAASSGTSPTETSPVSVDECARALTPPYGFPPPGQWIADPYRGGVNFCMYWGQINDPVNGSWTDVARAEVGVWLQAGAHNIQIRPDDSYDGDSQFTEISGLALVKKENYGLPPTSVEVTSWQSYAYSYPQVWVDQGTNGDSRGVHSIHIEAINVVVTSKAFEIQLDQPQIATARYFCPAWDTEDPQCRWPDGQEAPLFP